MIDPHDPDSLEVNYDGVLLELNTEQLIQNAQTTECHEHLRDHLTDVLSELSKKAGMDHETFGRLLILNGLSCIVAGRYKQQVLRSN